MCHTKMIHFPEYYMTPYTLFTLFCFVWIARPIITTLTYPLRIIKYIFYLVLPLFKKMFGCVIYRIRRLLKVRSY